jgi:hypothetical protein
LIAGLGKHRLRGPQHIVHRLQGLRGPTVPLVAPAEPARSTVPHQRGNRLRKPPRVERSTGASFNMPRYFAAAAAKLVTLRRDPFATGRPVCPLRRVEAALPMLFTSTTYPSSLPKQEFCGLDENESAAGSRLILNLARRRMHWPTQ